MHVDMSYVLVHICNYGAFEHRDFDEANFKLN
jgi:hypothetical protein